MSSEATTAESLLGRLSTGEITSESIVRDLLERADRAQRLNAFVHLDRDANWPRRGHRRETQSRRDGWPARGRPSGNQGRSLCRGRADHVR